MAVPLPSVPFIIVLARPSVFLARTVAVVPWFACLLCLPHPMYVLSAQVWPGRIFGYRQSLLSVAVSGMESAFLDMRPEATPLLWLPAHTSVTGRIASMVVCIIYNLLLWLKKWRLGD